MTGRVVPAQMGDSAGTNAIMGLDSERCRVDVAEGATSAVSVITQFFNDSNVILLNFIGICKCVLLKPYDFYYHL